MFLFRYIDYTKIKAQLANGITLLNLSFGIIAILIILKGYSHMSLLFIFLAALFDRFDGMVARKYNAESDFGKELDSLCDLVSFGVAPALLIYQTTLFEMPRIGMMLTILYILCGAIRLARYNVKEFDGVFYGIPITVAGVAMTLSSLLVPYLPILFFAILTALLTVLMVSNIRVAKV
ncbi:CDP-diacylglycerol--serine O-phosphatidyltransferase [Pueribacillus theae]|uniref:CDP-diacylglycerol--serine O-phosphatidyltransferase n=1 Tax=Pueribacillus theae TaxID=2171751 RepID=A0A2U1K5K4_9BACI|nr:CDP-diacylglycerol--serine O-phosphatidyltransferase [Pueribacillus theae]PWA12662.1 CDP-diacylglycerol--serine O-phosphatidyltransferase [Pueribacillus theae]